MKALLICLPLLLAAAPAGAQVLSGTVEGFYRGGVEASVTVLNEEGVAVAHRTTDRGGRFTVHLPVGGVYRLRVLADEYHPTVRTIRVRDDGTAFARIQLQERNASTSRLDDPGRMRSSGGAVPKEPRGGGGGAGSGKPGSEN